MQMHLIVLARLPGKSFPQLLQEFRSAMQSGDFVFILDRQQLEIAAGCRQGDRGGRVPGRLQGLQLLDALAVTPGVGPILIGGKFPFPLRHHLFQRARRLGRC